MASIRKTAKRKPRRYRPRFKMPPGMLQAMRERRHAEYQAFRQEAAQKPPERTTEAAKATCEERPCH